MRWNWNLLFQSSEEVNGICHLSLLLHKAGNTEPLPSELFFKIARILSSILDTGCPIQDITDDGRAKFVSAMQKINSNPFKNSITLPFFRMA